MKTAAPAGTRNGGDCSKGFGGAFESKQYTNQCADSTASYLIAEQIAQEFDPFSVDLALTFERAAALNILRQTDPSLLDLIDTLVCNMNAIDGDSDFEENVPGCPDEREHDNSEKEPSLGAPEGNTGIYSQETWAAGNTWDREQNIEGDDDELERDAAEECHR